MTFFFPSYNRDAIRDLQMLVLQAVNVQIEAEADRCDGALEQRLVIRVQDGRSLDREAIEAIKEAYEDVYAGYMMRNMRSVFVVATGIEETGYSRFVLAYA